MVVVNIQSKQHMLSGSNEFPSSGDSVNINPETMGGGSGSNAAGREVIQTPDAWEEW